MDYTDFVVVVAYIMVSFVSVHCKSGWLTVGGGWCLQNVAEGAQFPMRSSCERCA